MRQVVQVQTCWRLLRDGLLDLGALVPLIERRDGDNLGPHGQGCLQGCLVVLAIDPVPSIVVVPGPDAGVNVARPHAGDEHEVVGITKALHSLPVLMGGAEGETVGGEVGVHAVKPGRQDVVGVALFHQQRNEDPIVGGVADGVGPVGSQEVGPGFRGCQVGVIDIKEWKALTHAVLIAVKRIMGAIPEEQEGEQPELVA